MKDTKCPVLAIVGGGASGLAAAVFALQKAKSCGIRIKVMIFEANSRVGKKITVTGNGRCNFSNTDMSLVHFHGDEILARNALSSFSSEDTLKFFEEGGLFSRTDGAGRIYPLSNQATSVLDFFRNETARLGAQIITDCKITSVKKDGRRFLLNGEMYADGVIVSCGGKAAPVHGSDGSFFGVFDSFGVRTVDFYPALTPVCIDSFTKSLKGIRAEGRITVKTNGKTVASDCGELQYTDYGISGIPAMQVSGRVAAVLGKSKDVFAFVDSAPFLESDCLKEYILRIINDDPQRQIEMLLSGIMPKRLAVFLLSELSFKADKAVKTINPAAVDKIVSAVKNKKYKISAVKGFSDAQISSGGVPASELNADTLELKKVKNMYVCGEAVNVDGDCGGYNLQWAWSSAYVAASAAIGELANAQNK